MCLGVMAHQDPRGDIHPEVRVEDGCFAIYFQTNAESDRFSYEKPHWRMLYAPDGTVQLPRHRLSPSAEKKYEEAMAQPEASVEQGKWRLTLRLPGGEERPLAMELADGAVAHHSNVVGSLVGLLSSRTPKDENDALTLWLSWTDNKTFVPGGTVTLGQPASIYDFPCASRPVWAAQRWWIAWIRKTDHPNEPKRAWQTVLTCVDPRTRAVTHQTLNGQSHWNTGVSMKTTGGWLCIAWHASVEGDYPGKAKIVTEFVKLPDA